jgi:hypothetical protein
MHLWEIDHPYYCAEATWHKNLDGTFNHQRWAAWAEFRDDTIFTTGDRDLNLLFRWDWQSWRRHPSPSLRADEPDELSLFFVMQRKGFLASHTIHVIDDDEPEVRAFLTDCANTMTALWEPFDLGRSS